MEFGEELRETQSRTDGYEESTTVLNLYTEKINVKILYSGARREKLFKADYCLSVCWKKSAMNKQISSPLDNFVIAADGHLFYVEFRARVVVGR